jgi:hypothetical protein
MFWRSRAPCEGNCLAKFSLQTLAKKNKTKINENIGYKYQNMCCTKPLKKLKQDKRPDLIKALITYLCFAKFNKIHLEYFL